MPRNSQGVYTPPLPNVAGGTLIESQWANETIGDLADAMTESVTRSGTGSMSGPLTLASTLPSQPRHAASKSYVDSFVAYSSGLPIGAIMPYAAGSAPIGYLLCDGQAVDRATYTALFTLLGTSFGAGDGSTTFNVPNLVDQFIRGRNPATRTVGSLQASAAIAHNHPVNNGAHTHSITDPQHTHIQSGHAHTATDSGHTHGYARTNILVGNTAGSNGNNVSQAAAISDSGTANITVASTVAVNLAGSTGITGTNANTTFPTTGDQAGGDTETRPQNMALDLYIKAVADSTGPISVLSIDTSDSQMIAIGGTATVPILEIKANVAFGTVKLDSGNKIPSVLLPAGNQSLLGLFDASTGLNPSETYPTQSWSSGDTWIISDPGTITLIDPSTGLPAATVVDAGNQLTWVVSSGITLLQPTGWYYVIATVTSVVAGDVAFAPVGSITATDVQEMGRQLDQLKAPKASPTFTGIVTGVTATMTASSPVGTIPSSNVQDALAWVDAQKVALNGSGATGTWGISISGNAVTATNATNANVAASTTGNSATATTATKANGLTSLTTTVSVSGAAAPTAGQVLTASGSANASWVSPSTGGLTLRSAQAGAGASIVFSGLPTGMKRITLNFAGLSANGSSPYLIQMGASGVPEVTGYNATAVLLNAATPTVASSVAGFLPLQTVAAATLFGGVSVLTLVDAATNTWAFSSTGKAGAASVNVGAGDKAFSGSVNYLRITTANGTDTFDAGLVSLSYEL